MRRLVLLVPVLAVACVRTPSHQDFEALALGAAYAQFPRSAIDLVVSRTSGQPVACGYARNLDHPPARGPGEPFVWAEGEMYASDRFRGLKEADVIRLCGPNWVAPRSPDLNITS